MKVSTYTSILFLLAILLSVSVSAQTSPQYIEDFTLRGDTSYTVFQGTLHSTQFVVTNTGNIASSYSLTATDSAVASWTKMNPLQFTLQPGQTQQIQALLNIPVNAQPGSGYSLETFVTTAFGEQASIKQHVTVAIPQNVQLTSFADQTVLPCGKATFPVTITNIGPFPDTYALTVSKSITDIATFSTNDIILAPGQSGTINVFVTPTDCTWSGEMPFDITGTAATTDVHATLPATFTVTNAFIPDVTFDDLRMTSTKTSVNITLANTGVSTANYTLLVTETDSIVVTPKTVTLPADSETTLTLSAKGTIEQGKYPGVLGATVKGITYEFPFTANIRDYNWFETHKALTVLIIFAAIIIIIVLVLLLLKWIAYTKTPEYQQKKAERARIAAALAKQREAENSEKAKQKAKDKAEKEKQKELARKEKEAERKKQEAERVKAQKAKEKAALDAKLAKEHAKAKKEAERELKANNVLVSKESLVGDTVVRHGKGIWWFLLVLLLLVAGVVAYGFRTYLIANQSAAWVGLVVLLVAIFIIILFMMLRGTKIVKQSWTALKPRRENEIETGWKHGLGQLWLRVSQVVPNVTMTLRGSKTYPGSASAPEGEVYQYINVSAENLNEDLIESERFVFRVSQRWLASRQVSEGSIKLMRETPDGWKGIGTEKVRSDKKWVYYKASSEGLTTFAIVGKSKLPAEATGMAPGWWFVIFGIVIIAAILAGTWYVAHAGNAGTNVIGVSPTATGIPAQAWDEDTRLTLDLGTYFKDPDGDALVYTYTPIPHIIVTISGNKAMLMPEKDWFGTATTSFTATDGKGGKVTSNVVSLTVRDVAEPTFWTNLLAGLEHYSLYIVTGIILLVVLISILEYRRVHVKG